MHTFLISPFLSALSLPLAAQEFERGRDLTSSLNQVVCVQAADLDRDGDADLIAATQGLIRLSWLENQGDGLFGLPQSVSNTNGTPTWVTSGDLDGDGWPDLITVASGVDELAWHRNQSGASFGLRRVVASSQQSPSMVLARDLNQDGSPDLVVSSLDGTVAWYRNLGAGTFTQAIELTSGPGEASSIDCIDFDQDGDLDILASFLSSSGRVSWFENQGAGQFSAEQLIAAPGSIRQVLAADFDRDLDLDLLLVNEKESRVQILANLGAGAFSQPISVTDFNPGLRSAQIADIDGDGDPDVIACAAGGLNLAWLRNLGQGSFSPPQTLEDQAIAPTFVARTDIERDGDLDLVLAATGLGKLIVYENRSAATGGFSLFLREHATGSPTYGHATSLGDLDGDFYYEYGVADRQNWNFDVFDGRTGQRLFRYTNGTDEAFGVAACGHPDLDGDGIREIAVGEPTFDGQHENQGAVRILSGATGVSLRLVFGPPAAATAQFFGAQLVEFVDVNGDGHAEILAGASRGGQLASDAGSVSCIDGQTSQILYTVEGLASGDFAAAIGRAGPDLDGDGIAEFAVGARESFGLGTGYLSIHSGKDGRRLGVIPGFGGLDDEFGAGHCWVDDVDGDGKDDLVISAPGADTYGLDRGRVAVFSSATGAWIRDLDVPSEVAKGFGTSWTGRLAQLADADHDGRSEVLIAAAAVHYAGQRDGMVYVCSPNTGRTIERLLPLHGPMPGFGVQVEVLEPHSLGDRLILGGSDLSGQQAGYAYVFDYDGRVDLDRDDDGIYDSDELAIYGTSPLAWDSDGDGISDGTELGFTTRTPDTSPDHFQPDLDPRSTTDPLNPDSDGGGILDGIEDQGGDGRVDLWDTSPHDATDDGFVFYARNFYPNKQLELRTYGATPNTVVMPYYSATGNDPTWQGSVLLNLSPPIYPLAHAVTDHNGNAIWKGGTVPRGARRGAPVWFQLVDSGVNADQRVSNGIMLPVSER